MPTPENRDAAGVRGEGGVDRHVAAADPVLVRDQIAARRAGGIDRRRGGDGDVVVRAQLERVAARQVTGLLTAMLPALAKALGRVDDDVVARQRGLQRRAC
jgi:hypothetical protein